MRKILNLAVIQVSQTMMKIAINIQWAQEKPRLLSILATPKCRRRTKGNQSITSKRRCSPRNKKNKELKRPIRKYS